MGERPPPYNAGERTADLAQRFVDDPHLYGLLQRAKDAFNELAAYMAGKCKEAGLEMPAEWLDLAKRESVEKRRTAAPPDGGTAAGEG
jgi:hypothetical protein